MKGTAGTFPAVIDRGNTDQCKNSGGNALRSFLFMLVFEFHR